MRVRGVVRSLVWVAALAFVQVAVAAPALAAPLTARPQIALTFDDAPTAATPLLLTLQQKNATATFFLEGELAQTNSEQARAIADAGMLIGNHSYDHAHFVTATAEQIRVNLALAQTAIHAETGVTPRWFRAPYLDQSPFYTDVMAELGLRISWPTINPKDWSGPPPQKIVDFVLERAAPGGVVILHDMNDQTNTVEALPGLIDGLRALGYDLVTLDDIGLGAIEGTVTAGGGGPVAGAVVSAYDGSGNEVASASSDAGGHYRLARLAPGSYRVGFSAAECVPAYYGPSATLGDATPVVLSADHTIVGADARLEALTALALAVTPDTVVAGEQANITITLTQGSTTGTALAGQTVSVSESPDGVTWGTPTPYVTDRSGVVTLSLRPRGVVHYRAHYAGEPGVYSPSASDTARINVTTPLRTALSARTSATRPAYGARVTITGALTRAVSASPELPNQRVLLRSLSSGGWKTVAEATSTPSGRVSFVVTQESRTEYRLLYGGVYGAYRPAVSEPVVVKPKAAVGTPVAPPVMARGRARTVHGTLRPLHRAGTKRVRIYRWRRVGGSWRRYGHVHATVSTRGAHSRYAAKVRLPRTGTWRLRAYVPADAQHAAAWSKGYDYVRVR